MTRFILQVFALVLLASFAIGLSNDRSASRITPRRMPPNPPPPLVGCDAEDFNRQNYRVYGPDNVDACVIDTLSTAQLTWLTSRPNPLNRVSVESPPTEEALSFMLEFYFLEDDGLLIIDDWSRSWAPTEESVFMYQLAAEALDYPFNLKQIMILLPEDPEDSEDSEDSEYPEGTELFNAVHTAVDLTPPDDHRIEIVYGPQFQPTNLLGFGQQLAHSVQNSQVYQTILSSDSGYLARRIQVRDIMAIGLWVPDSSAPRTLNAIHFFCQE